MTWLRDNNTHLNADYQPKGGMCANCAKAKEDCSKLPFNTMRVLEFFEGVRIVKCDEHVKIN